MNFSFSNKRIAGVLTVLPANERTFMDDMKEFDFPEAKSLKLKKVMGYDKHRIVKDDATCVSDLAVHGFRHLFERGWSSRRSSTRSWSSRSRPTTTCRPPATSSRAG